MNNLRRTAVTAAMMLSFAVAMASTDESIKGPKEMLFGQFYCSTFPDQGPQTHGSLQLSGTSGLFVSNADFGPVSVFADFEPGGVRVCDAFARDARVKLEAAGCRASQISTSDPDQNNNSARRSVQFVCSGVRDKMVDTLARLVELVVMNGR